MFDKVLVEMLKHFTPINISDLFYEIREKIYVWERTFSSKGGSLVNVIVKLLYYEKNFFFF